MPGRNIQIPDGDRQMPGYAVTPPGATRGVIVIHELLGRMPEIDAVVERFGDAGFAAVEPDLFHRGKLRCIVQSLTTISKGKGPMSDRLLAARAWLATEASLDESRIGVIGFCLGGGLALALGPNFAAVSTNYGDIPPTEVLRGSPPVIGCYGGRDRVFGNNGVKLRRHLAVHGVEPEIHNFDSVGHSFLTHGHHPVANALTWPLFEIRWNPEVAEQGWAKIMAFFERELPRDPPVQ